MTSKPKKRIYSVNAAVVGSKWLGNYLAASPEEAIAKAIDEHGYVSLCHQCESQCEDAAIDTETVTAEVTDSPEEQPRMG